jgi:hypothetical protein
LAGLEAGSMSFSTAAAAIRTAMANLTTANAALNSNGAILVQSSQLNDIVTSLKGTSGYFDSINNKVKFNLKFMY